MSSQVDRFCVWAERARVALPSTATIEIVKCADQAFLDVDVPGGALGRLSYWMSGSADATAYDSKGNLVDLSSSSWPGSWDHIAPADFDRAFAHFINVFNSIDAD